MPNKRLLELARADEDRSEIALLLGLGFYAIAPVLFFVINGMM